MKSLLCAIAKNENKYLDEWIKHHNNIGFDGIILYDNNDINGEIINTKEYDSVKVIDYRGKHINVPEQWRTNNIPLHDGIQEQAYNECYHTHAKQYDWVAFIDVDEFLFLENDMKINDFLKQEKFNDVDAIQFNWETYGDNGKIKYENIPVLQRFTTKAKHQPPMVKTIVKTNNPNFVTLQIHNAIIRNGKFSSPEGIKQTTSPIQYAQIKENKIKHFYTKTLEEWIDRKCGKTNADGRDMLNIPEKRVAEFFIYNEKTEEKTNLIKSKLNIEI